MADLILVPLADNPTGGAHPLKWSLELWGAGNPWFAAEEWPSFYDRAAQANYLAWNHEGSDQELIYLALIDSEVVGAIALVDFDDVEEFRTLKPWVAAFVVNPALRGRGIGSQMLAAIEKQAKAFGIRELYLWTEDKKDFYSKRGYQELHHRDYPEISIDVLRKSL